MDRISPTEKKTEQDLFISVECITEYCKIIIGREIHSKNVQFLIDSYFLPVFNFNSKFFVLKKDLESIFPVLTAMSDYDDDAEPISGNLFWEGITISPNTKISMSLRDTKINSSFYVAARKIVQTANLLEQEKYNKIVNLHYFPPTRIITSSPMVDFEVAQQIERAKLAEPSISDFARSAHYMGSKRNLAGFLVEGISTLPLKDGIVVDLMCGSGAASAAFNNIWETIASDVQSFCRILAIVQGAGFSTVKADKLIKKLLPLAREHVDSLLNILGETVGKEEKILHGDVGPNLLNEYQNFIESFPTYPDETKYKEWFPKYEVEKRRNNEKLYPYCLFTAYFSNIYFGLRQCIEIDSIRYAIDQIEDTHERSWALGALVTTLSALGTTFAAHFAQPKFRDTEQLNLNNLPKVLEQRAYSVFHEFSIRLMNLSEESEKKTRLITTVSGPWKEALQSLSEKLKGKNVVVYLDAPYKREEYSRYYHVLETLVSYSYPSSIGKGKLPEKGTKERPRSEFFTRVSRLANEAFIDIITSILKENWMCAWSYAHTGDANIITVINEVNKLIPCNVISYSTPYEHKSQGKKVSNKKVTEYLILFTPKHNL